MNPEQQLHFDVNHVRSYIMHLNRFMQLYFPTAQCPPLPEIANGMISYLPDNTPDYDVGTTANYICEDGFTLSGDVTRDCQSDGTFSGMEPVCSMTREWTISMLLLYSWYIPFQLCVLNCLLLPTEKLLTVLLTCHGR